MTFAPEHSAQTLTMDTKNCLIVDDEQMIVTLISETLTTRGYRCVTASSGEQALEILAESSFDIMITDIQMSGITGIELTKAAKKLYEDLPIIVVTGFVEEYSYDEVIEAGAADFIRKPFSMLELETRMARIIRDANLLAVMRKRGKDLEAVSTLMIAGLQEEAYEKVEALREEIKRLKEDGSLKKE